MATDKEYLPTCDPDVTPIAASKLNRFISRRAIDPSGRLGSLYDVYSDRILPNSNISFLTQSADSCRHPKCYMKACNADECTNLLKWLNMEDELRLSVLSQMTPVNGIAALINYSRPIDKYTRFLEYKHYSWTEYLEDSVLESSNEIRPERPDTRATHMIALVNWGIDAVVILQLPPDDEQTEEIDFILQKLCVSLSDDHSKLTLTEKKNNATLTPSVTILPSDRPDSDESINILLLGESGVGKSTFINAFVNYLKFDKLKAAEKNPVVLIPVSFIMTTDDNFTEHVVKFEGNDTLSNEDYDHLGQSVTQHCKSYVFALKNGDNHGRKLRIIDTPGIGSTYGSSQDDANLQQILSYINNLTHLNAICILLKANNPRINIFFRSCFMQLLDVLGENTRDRIIFCFTNSRSTFYTPGSTASSLKALLNSLPDQKIPFTKENAFCFD
ncbi:unnamed protein product, partial [Rotaria sp. Silwood1]